MNALATQYQPVSKMSNHSNSQSLLFLENMTTSMTGMQLKRRIEEKKEKLHKEFELCM